MSLSDNASSIWIYDTTLRDGSQREGVSFSLEDKVKITKRLDEFGIHYIEGGWPGSNPKDEAYFKKVAQLKLNHAKIAAFGSTTRKGTLPQDDPNIQALLAANTPVVTLVGKSWDFHVKHVLETSLEENLKMIRSSVAYIKSLGKEVVYDGEHFYDGYKANPDYALATFLAAQEGGADVLVLCETNGGCLPWEVEAITKAVKSKIDIPLGIHAHNDSGCGVANSLAAVHAGAVHVQGTINGYGERVGNADLCAIIPNLQLKMEASPLPPEKLARLTEISYYVAEVANLPRDRHAPYVGESAFTHKGGIHVAAMLKNAQTYQHVDPELVGNTRRSVVSELSGRGNLVEKSQLMGLDLDSRQSREMLSAIKELEAQGFTFESAEGTVNVMLQRMQSDYSAPFELIDFVVIVEHRQGRGILAEANVKVRIGDRIIHTAAEGNGPVNALDSALRKALVDIYPKLATIRLDDYKVRILDSENGTSAAVRVLIDTKNGAHRWSTVGAGTNIIDASWRAIADSMEYAIINSSNKSCEETVEA
ncbi:MAG: citramalate synthase [Anaerolineales bacterium]|nr:citramalate synthase [Anaerolineales bacterium]